MRTRVPNQSARRLLTSLVVAITLIAGVGLQPVSADELIAVSNDELLIARPGTLTRVAEVAVEPARVGENCRLTVASQNQASIHDGNDLIVTTGEQTTVIADVEAEANATIDLSVEIVLGSTIAIDLQMGPDWVSSLGFELWLDCGTIEQVLATGDPAAVCTEAGTEPTVDGDPADGADPATVDGDPAEGADPATVDGDPAEGTDPATVDGESPDCVVPVLPDADPEPEAEPEPDPEPLPAPVEVPVVVPVAEPLPCPASTTGSLSVVPADCPDPPVDEPVDPAPQPAPPEPAPPAPQPVVAPAEPAAEPVVAPSRPSVNPSAEPGLEPEVLGIRVQRIPATPAATAIPAMPNYNG